MKIIEFRLVLPMSLDEYQRGHRYTLAKASRLETGQGEGVEILHQEPFHNASGPGLYIHKRVHLHSRLPRWARALLPSDVLTFEEKTWNQFPYTRTEYSSSYLDEKVRFKVETIVQEDNGCCDNVHGLEGKLLAKRKVDFIDIAHDQKAVGLTREDPATCHSTVTGRGPLQPGWHTNAQPVCCAYKLATIHINLFGIQRKVEKLIQKQALRAEFCKSHRQMFCWMDHWHGMSLDEIGVYEEQTKASLHRILHGIPDRPTPGGSMFGIEGTDTGGGGDGFGSAWGDSDVGLKVAGYGWVNSTSTMEDGGVEYGNPGAGIAKGSLEEQSSWYPPGIYQEQTPTDVWAPVANASHVVSREFKRASVVHETFGKTEWALLKARSSRVRSTLKFTEAEENLKRAQRLVIDTQEKLNALYGAH